jgi:hypothetical protein
MIAPGDITPVVLGLTLPSASSWMTIFLGLYAIYALLAVGSHIYWRAVAEDQFSDPSQREHMNLGVNPGPLSNHYKATADRLAEPARGTAPLWHAWLLGYFLVVTAAATVILGLYVTVVM